MLFTNTHDLLTALMPTSRLPTRAFPVQARYARYRCTGQPSLALRPRRLPGVSFPSPGRGPRSLLSPSEHGASAFRPRPPSLIFTGCAAPLPPNSQWPDSAPRQQADRLRRSPSLGINNGRRRGGCRVRRSREGLQRVLIGREACLGNVGGDSRIILGDGKTAMPRHANVAPCPALPCPALFCSPNQRRAPS